MIPICASGDFKFNFEKRFAQPLVFKLLTHSDSNESYILFILTLFGVEII
jgi:hypothetical protein